MYCIVWRTVWYLFYLFLISSVLSFFLSLPLFLSYHLFHSLCLTSPPLPALPVPALLYLALPCSNLVYLNSLNPLIHFYHPTLPCPALSLPALPYSVYPALPCLVSPYPALSCLTLPCPVLSQPTLPCPALPCLTLPCPALSCLTLPCLVSPCRMMSTMDLCHQASLLLAVNGEPV